MPPDDAPHVSSLYCQYPSENAYQEFLSQHGGASNAFTAADRACYFFDVSHEYLRGALDRCVHAWGDAAISLELIGFEKSVTHCVDICLLFLI